MIWGIVVGAAVVLAMAGVAKLAKPAVTAQAVRSADLPAGVRSVTALGAAELVVGVVVALWQPSLGAAVLALFYLGFAIFSVRLLVVRGPEASCGCFGQTDAPIGAEHVVVNLVVGAVAGAAAAGIGTTTTNPVVALGTAVVLFGILAIYPAVKR